MRGPGEGENEGEVGRGKWGGGVRNGGGLRLDILPWRGFPVLPRCTILALKI
jgi:hypothetical protein